MVVSSVSRIMAATMLICGGATILSAQTPAPSVSLAGTIYAQYSYQLQADSSLSPVAHGNNFDVTRAYLRALGRFANGIQTQVTIDVDGRKAAANQQTLRLKYAYVGWTPENSPLTAKFGLIQTAWNDFEEAVWDYRIQGTIPMERAGYLTSSDFGVSVEGTWDSDRFAMQAGIYNGEGYSNSPGDQRKDFQARASYRLKRTNLTGRVGGLRISGYAQMGHSNGGGKRQRYIALLSYKTPTLTLAGQVGVAIDSTSVTTPEQHGRLLSAYGTYRLSETSKVSLIGRWDQFDPNLDSTSNAAASRLAVNRQNRLIAGIAYTLSPNLRLLADVDLNSLQGGSPDNAFNRGSQSLTFRTEVKF